MIHDHGPNLSTISFLQGEPHKKNVEKTWFPWDNDLQMVVPHLFLFLQGAKTVAFFLLRVPFWIRTSHLQLAQRTGWSRLCVNLKWIYMDKSQPYTKKNKNSSCGNFSTFIIFFSHKFDIFGGTAPELGAKTWGSVQICKGLLLPRWLFWPSTGLALAHHAKKRPAVWWAKGAKGAILSTILQFIYVNPSFTIYHIYIFLAYFMIILDISGQNMAKPYPKLFQNNQRHALHGPSLHCLPQLLTNDALVKLSWPHGMLPWPPALHGIWVKTWRVPRSKRARWSNGVNGMNGMRYEWYEWYGHPIGHPDSFFS